MQMETSVEHNTEKAIAAVKEAADQGAKLICLPELFRSRYFCQSQDVANFALAEPIPGPGTKVFAELSKQLDVVIVASLFERRAAGVYHNTAAVLDGASGYVGKYRKMHIPDDPRYYEKFYFTPGDLGFKSFATSAGRIGVLICWDQWYPEAARLTALRGADILIYPTAIGWHPEEQEAVGLHQHAAWETVQRGHAIANGCFVLSVNRTGFEPDPSGAGGIQFWGQSFAAAPNGEVLVRATADEEQVLTLDIDLAQIDETRVNWPFLRDRRIDAYAEIERRFIDDN
jgi:N-carbamoylputrescine amidase